MAEAGATVAFQGRCIISTHLESIAHAHGGTIGVDLPGPFVKLVVVTLDTNSGG